MSVLFVGAVIGFSFNDKTHYARQLIVVTLALGVGVAVSLIGLRDVNILVTLTVPLLVIALFGLTYKVAKNIRRKSLLGQSLFALAVIVLLLGVFISAGAKTSATVNDVKLNTSYEMMQMKMVVTSINIENSTTKYTMNRRML